MTELKCNYKNFNTDLKCNLCGQYDDTTEHLLVCQNQNQTDINQLFLSEDKNSIEQMAKQVREALERKQIDVAKNKGGKIWRTGYNVRKTLSPCSSCSEPILYVFLVHL